MTLPKNYKVENNQYGVALNPLQGKHKKVLCVCSAGVLRSPTLANVLHKNFGYNTRAVGSSIGFALIPLTEALIAWSDEVVFVDQDCYDILDDKIKDDIDEYSPKRIVLDVSDDYNYGTEELENLLMELYMRS